jgi:hypothetical protein
MTLLNYNFSKNFLEILADLLIILGDLFIILADLLIILGDLLNYFLEEKQDLKRKTDKKMNVN